MKFTPFGEPLRSPRKLDETIEDVEYRMKVMNLLFRALMASCICRYSAALHTSKTSSCPLRASVAV